MSTATLDTNDDWTLGRGKNAYLTGIDEVRQNIATRVKEFTDDWFLDVEKGINWIGYLGSKNTKDSILADIKQVILSTEGVATITAISLTDNRIERELKVDYTVTTIYNYTLTDTVST